jgi:hypothetical protein
MLTAEQFDRAEREGRLLEAVVADWLAGYERIAGPWRLRPLRWLACAAIESDRDGAPFVERTPFGSFAGWTARLPLWPRARLAVWWYRRSG